jgi:hypothetical protein
MTNPTTKDDINDAADDVAKVADALHDMLMGEREVVIEFWMVDILMSAHGVLWGLADERDSLAAENVKLRALVEEAERVCLCAEETIYDAIEFVDDEKEKRLSCEDDEENPKTPYALAAIATSDDLAATHTVVRSLRTKLRNKTNEG